MLQSNQIEELITLVSSLDRDALVAHLRTYRANFPVDFTADYLNRLPLDKLRHIFVAALERLPFGCGNLPDHLLLGFVERSRRHPISFQVGFVQTDGIPFAPIFKQVGTANFTRFDFIVRGVAAHSEGFREDDCRATAAACEIRSEPGGRVSVEDVIAVTRIAGNAVRFAPCGERTDLMLVESRAESDLIVLENKNRRNVEYRGKIHSFVKGRGFRGSITGPGESDGALPFLARFPRPGRYRGWLQFQRHGVVVTSAILVEAGASE